MPFALESFDLSGYDLIISSDQARQRASSRRRRRRRHICYCHSPMRYLWDHYHFYRSNAGLASRLMLPVLAPLLRSWDVNTSLRVDRFIANSHHVSARIGKYYRRPATVLYPPVSVDDFTPAAATEDFYLCAGQLIPYKRIDLAVRAFTKMNRNLVIIGEGKEMASLRRLAGPTITFLGQCAVLGAEREAGSLPCTDFPRRRRFRDRSRRGHGKRPARHRLRQRRCAGNRRSRRQRHVVRGAIDGSADRSGT